MTTMAELQTKLLTVDQWSPQAATILAEIERVGAAEIATATAEESMRFDRVGSWRVERPAPEPLTEPATEVVLGELPAHLLPHRAAIERAEQRDPGMGRRLTALLKNIQRDEVVGVEHYQGESGAVRLAERRAQLVEAAGGPEVHERFWKVIDKHQLRGLAESVQAADSPEVVAMVAGWEFMPS